MADDELLDILHDLGLSSCFPYFQREKITLDIVSKLSLQELEMLGIKDKDKIMQLRIKCSVYSTATPNKVHNQRAGAPKFNIPRHVLENIIEEDFTIKEISCLLGISERTVYRRMHEFNLSKYNFTCISEEDLDAIVTRLAIEFPKCGERMLNKILRGQGIVTQRSVLRESILRVDPIGNEERKKNRLHRRIYNVQGPNHLWHVDTNHKLIRWHFVIFGAIDGYSRLSVVLECTSNNKATTLLECFLKGVQEYGTPSRVRSDKGLENVLIADYMIGKQGENRGSMLTGKSTHNQRIERLWRDVYNGVLSFFYELFYYMEEVEILDPLNEHHLCSLHYVYLPKINEKLQIWREAWANHRMRTTKTSPLKLWVSGQMNNLIGEELAPQDLESYGLDGYLDEINTQDGQRPIFSELYRFNEQIFARLENEIDKNLYDDDSGITMYICVRDTSNI